MRTRNQTLIAVSVLLTIATANVLPVQAGLLDWFKTAQAKTDTAPSNGSFNALYASVMSNDLKKQDDTPLLLANAMAPVNSPVGGVTKASHRTYTVQVSGYSSEVAQTDDSPFITAMGTHVRDGIVATNMFPFGTVIKMPSLYGDKIFVVEDRMNSRYQNNVDIWFVEKADALKLGRRTVTIEVIK